MPLGTKNTDFVAYEAILPGFGYEEVPKNSKNNTWKCIVFINENGLISIIRPFL